MGSNWNSCDAFRSIHPIHLVWRGSIGFVERFVLQRILLGSRNHRFRRMFEAGDENHCSVYSLISCAWWDDNMISHWLIGFQRNFLALTFWSQRHSTVNAGQTPFFLFQSVSSVQDVFQPQYWGSRTPCCHGKTRGGRSKTTIGQMGQAGSKKRFLSDICLLLGTRFKFVDVKKLKAKLMGICRYICDIFILIAAMRQGVEDSCGVQQWASYCCLEMQASVAQVEWMCCQI